jgi:hypothetical protein
MASTSIVVAAATRNRTLGDEAAYVFQDEIFIHIPIFCPQSFLQVVLVDETRASQ